MKRAIVVVRYVDGLSPFVHGRHYRKIAQSFRADCVHERRLKILANAAKLYATARATFSTKIPNRARIVTRRGWRMSEIAVVSIESALKSFRAVWPSRVGFRNSLSGLKIAQND